VWNTGSFALKPDGEEDVADWPIHSIS